MELSLQREVNTKKPVIELKLEGLEQQAAGEAVRFFKGNWPRDPSAENHGRTAREQLIFEIDDEALLNGTPNGSRVFFDTVETVRFLGGVIADYLPAMTQYPEIGSKELFEAVGGLAFDLLTAVNPQPDDLSTL